MTKRKPVPDPENDDPESNSPASFSPAKSSHFTTLLSKYTHSSTKLITPLPPRPSAKKPKRRPKNPGYAPPSTYAHIPTPDLDCLAPNLHLLFIGLNPGHPPCFDPTDFRHRDSKGPARVRRPVK
jgi:hypothetical protein